MFESEAKFFRKLLRDDGVDGQFIFDIGSGTTQHLKEYAPFYFEEIRQPLIDRGNILLNLDLQVGGGIDIVADCHNIPFADQFIDVVLLFSLLEHVRYPHQVIKEIYRVLKSSGVCYASVPAGGYPHHPDPIDTRLRLSSLGEWQELFRSAFWDISLFEHLDVYHPVRKMDVSLTMVRIDPKGLVIESG